ncbi:MAG: hypothetical protein AAGH71_05960 [Planctomycetota bacterium]
MSLLAEAADHEALFTLVGGLKPMSTGIWSSSFCVDDPALEELRSVRAALAPLRNDIWYADVQVFATVRDGERLLHAYVVHRASFARMINRYDTFWSPWGITSCTSPPEVLAVVDRMPMPDRWRGYGYLFGYPPDAVDFFVRAGVSDGQDDQIGPGKDRRFVQIPTYAAEVGRFTYAVPLDHVPTADDAAIAIQAGDILAEYTQRRERMRSVHSMVRELRRLNTRFVRAADQPVPAVATPAHGAPR